MSSGKSVASILMALMVDCGFLDFDEKVTKYWPEFGKNWKGHIRVKDVMRHGCGLHRLHQVLEKDWMLPENIKRNKIGKVIENDISFQQPGFNRRYHPMSRDWIANEIFRRCDPSGRTMGEVLREIRYMYNIDIICGAKEEELHDCLPWNLISSWRTFKNLWYGPLRTPTYYKLGDIPSLLKNRKK